MKVEYNFASSSEAVVKEIVNNDTVLTLKLVGTIVSQTERVARVFEGVNEPATGMRLTIGEHAPGTYRLRVENPIYYCMASDRIQHDPKTNTWFTDDVVESDGGSFMLDIPIGDHDDPIQVMYVPVSPIEGEPGRVVNIHSRLKFYGTNLSCEEKTPTTRRSKMTLRQAKARAIGDTGRALIRVISY